MAARFHRLPAATLAAMLLVKLDHENVVHVERTRITCS